MSRRVLLISLLSTILHLVTTQVPNPSNACFCKASDEGVDNCACDVDSVDLFNNHRIFPLLQALLQKSFFRFYRVRFFPL